ncbi:MAG: 23S rRNA (adenine(2503)-C(2))-methyltransferase RlmN, partial [Anderseniella sp.]|nr:23S rRNA (adenine(2503)-C(2))-methyltransferase RlmN [Anderseniella sp.]
MTVTLDIDRHRPAACGAGATALIRLIGMTRPQLQAALERIGIPGHQSRMRASQLWHWLYHRGAASFSEMTNISKDLRARFADAFDISRL